MKVQEGQLLVRSLVEASLVLGVVLGSYMLVGGGMRRMLGMGMEVGDHHSRVVHLDISQSSFLDLDSHTIPNV